MMVRKKLFGFGIPLGLVLVAVGVLAVCIAQKPYTGRVTEAGTGAPISNVMVTDGRNVTKTDENGEFKVKGYLHTRFISVTTPAGYTSEKFYIPTDGKNKKYDFVLTKDERTANPEHSFVQVTDTEVGAGGVGGWINDIKEIVDEEKPAFVVHTGDICYEDGLKSHIKGMNRDTMGVPVYYVIGNHDYVKGKYGEELYESIYGPSWYSFEVGNVHYVVTPFQYGDYVSGYAPNDRWKWLENDLKNVDPDKEVIIFNHTLPPSDDYVIRYPGKKLDLKEFNLLAWVYGHYHANHVEMKNGVLSISTSRPDCGGIDSSPAGPRLIKIGADNSISTETFYYEFDSSMAKTPENKVWSSQLSGNNEFSDPVYENGKVYVATAFDDFPRKCGVYCIDEKTGDILWFKETANSVKSCLVLKDGKVYTQSTDGTVYCISAENGKSLWEKKISVGTGVNTVSGICLDENLVFAGNSSWVTALNAETGEVVWENPRKKGETSPAEFVVCGDKLLVSSNWDALVALDKNTGKELWKNDRDGIRYRSSTPAVADEKTIVVADSDKIFVVNAETGEMIKMLENSGFNYSTGAQPLVLGDTAYISTSSDGVVAYSIKENKIIWHQKVGSALVGTAPYCSFIGTVESDVVEDGDNVVFGASDGYLYIVNKADGNLVKKINIGAPLISTPAVTDSGIIVADFAGRVTKISK